MSRGLRTACATLGLAVATLACAPLGPYRPPAPVTGAVTNFASGSQARGPAEGRYDFTGTDASRHHLGELQSPAAAESTVVIVYGDNRPGFRTRTQGLGWAQIRDFQASKPASWAGAAVGLPLAVLQLAVPTMDGPQDLAVALGTHRPNGGGEAQVLRAIEEELPVDLVISSGDLVYDGRRGKLWDDFVRKHAALRERATYLATPGNHERIHTADGKASWDAVVGPPPSPGRYWYTADLRDGLARIVFLDSNVLTDAKNVYDDGQEADLSDAQLRWLDTALDTDARYKIVVLHHPLWSAGSHVHSWGESADDAAWQRRDALLELLARRGVAAVFAGHEHLYNRHWVRGGQRGFWHVTTGGAGSPLYPLRPSTRAAGLARPLPDGLSIETETVRTEVAYHFCKLVFPRDGEPRIDVYKVWSGGGHRLIDRLPLAGPAR